MSDNEDTEQQEAAIVRENFVLSQVGMILKNHNRNGKTTFTIRCNLRVIESISKACSGFCDVKIENANYYDRWYCLNQAHRAVDWNIVVEPRRLG